MPTQPQPTKEELIQQVIDSSNLVEMFANRDALVSQIELLNNEISAQQDLQQDRINRIEAYFKAQETLNAGLNLDLE